VFTARYALSPYIKQIRFVFKGLISVPYSHRRGPCSIPCQSRWHLWWTTWHWHKLRLRKVTVVNVENFSHVHQHIPTSEASKADLSRSVSNSPCSPLPRLQPAPRSVQHDRHLTSHKRYVDPRSLPTAPNKIHAHARTHAHTHSADLHVCCYALVPEYATSSQTAACHCSW
jgi:hypothetical protein